MLFSRSSGKIILLSSLLCKSFLWYIADSMLNPMYTLTVLNFVFLSVTEVDSWAYSSLSDSSLGEWRLCYPCWSFSSLSLWRASQRIPHDEVWLDQCSFNFFLRNSMVIGVVYLSFSNLMLMVLLIIRSRLYSMEYGFLLM